MMTDSKDFLYAKMVQKFHIFSLLMIVCSFVEHL